VETLESRPQPNAEPSAPAARGPGRAPGHRTQPDDVAAVPMRSVGPVRITGPVMDEAVQVPLATFETPLWPSVDRGAKVSMLCGGIHAVVVDERMTRSVIVEATDAAAALAAAHALRARFAEMAAAAGATSRYAELIDVHTQIVGNLLFVRLAFRTGDAAGHNMATLAAQAALDWLLAQFPLQYVSISGNYCTDKKVSAVNGILGRGRNVVTEIVVPRSVCRRLLRTTPAALAALHVRKNLVGSVLAGGVRSANAHYANMLLAFYLATGQDGANVVEGSQGLVHAEVRGDALYFSATVPHVIVGSVGAGKALPFVQRNLERLGCTEARPVGENARRLAVIAAATVLCGELSLLAAQANRGELAATHRRLERT
jgi:hydroxymethylglutaryl-CoA reductase (NADPH)